jgi:hypothetical protein
MMSRKYLILLFIIVWNQSYSQAMIYSTHAKLMQINNPSYYGLNNWNRSGLLYSTTQVNLNESQNNKFFKFQFRIRSEYFISSTNWI